MSGTWVHEQELSFKKLNGSLSILKNLVMEAIEKNKIELQRHISIRDSLK